MDYKNIDEKHKKTCHKFVISIPGNLGFWDRNPEACPRIQTLWKI